MGMPMKLFVSPDSGIVTPADLAGKPVAINENSGSHYVAIEVLEQYMPKDQIKLVHIGQPFARYEFAGHRHCRRRVHPRVPGFDPRRNPGRALPVVLCVVAAGLVANEQMPAEVYERFQRAVARAAERINQNPDTYKHMLVDQLKWTGVSPELVEQVRERIVMPKYQAPETYSEEAFQECYDWMLDRERRQSRHRLVATIAWNKVTRRARFLHRRRLERC